jgi:hypothetical protein
MNNSTTSISDLPSDPTGGGISSGNISMSIQENDQQMQAQMLPPSQQPNSQSQPANQIQGNGTGNGFSLDQTTINQIVNGLQKASVNGLTQLPSRDIPRTTETITNDAQIQPNFIPQPNPAQMQEDYIQKMQQSNQSMNEIIDEHNKKANFSSSLDNLYDEIQTPLLLTILFFIFQLPIFKKYLFLYVPFLFFNDGNYNLKGYLTISVLFGCIYYFCNKVINVVNF